MQPLISVIIPVYNVEKYLRECVDSAINQTYNNLEIILVNDGSTDNSGCICDEYALNDNRVLVIHKTNNGPSAARNTGIDIAKGEYLHFIDGDDWIENDTIEILYLNLITYDADISSCGYYKVFLDLKIRKLSNLSIDVVALDREEAIKAVLERKYAETYAGGKLFRRHLFSAIRFPVNTLSEDAYIIIDLLLEANKVVFTTVSKYSYRQRKSSLSHIEKRERGLCREIDLRKYYLMRIEEKHESLIAFAILLLYKFFMQFDFRLSEIPDDFLPFLRYSIKSNNYIIKKSEDKKALSAREKICFFLIKHNQCLFLVLWKASKDLQRLRKRLQQKRNTSTENSENLLFD
jgi:glycosyltransferase involved in cell wall biosynthesis